MPVAPPMFAQLLPSESQRRHWYAYAIGAVPSHVPVVVVSVSPTRAMPERPGRHGVDGRGDDDGGVPRALGGRAVGVGGRDANVDAAADVCRAERVRERRSAGDVCAVVPVEGAPSPLVCERHRLGTGPHPLCSRQRLSVARVARYRRALAVHWRVADGERGRRPGQNGQERRQRQQPAAEGVSDVALPQGPIGWARAGPHAFGVPLLGYLTLA